jgi:glycosyltransferase involved in cell wall biosynthesis
VKILHTVEFYYPSVGGAQEVVRQLSERLVKLGHDVTVATTRLPERQTLSHNGVKIKQFDVSGRAATGYSGADIEKYKNFLSQPNFDVIMNYAAQQWATDLTFEVINKIKAGKVLVPCGFSGLYNPSFKDYFAKMPKIMSEYDVSVYLSNDYRDINFARTHKIKNTRLIPNGAGKDEFTQPISFSLRKRLGIPNSDFLILLVGSHTGLKGHAEAIEIFKRANIRGATLLIIGNVFEGGCAEACIKSSRRASFGLSSLHLRKKIFVRNLSRIETVAAYKEADLFLLPSNIEASPLVLFEAMAGKTAFLITDVGNAKEIIKWSHGGLLLPTKKDKAGYSHAEIKGSSQQVEEIYTNKVKLEELAENGHRAWDKQFTWEIITGQYEQLYEEVRRS